MKNINQWWGLLCFFACTQLYAQNPKIELLHSGINTKLYDEIAPVVSSDEQTIYFTRQGFPVFNHTLMEKGVDLSHSLSKQDYLRKLNYIYSSLSGKEVRHPINSSFNQDIWIARSRNAHLDQISHPSYPLNNAFPNSICALFNKEQSAIVINEFPKDGGIKKGFSIIHKTSQDNWSYPQPITIEGIKDINPEVSLAVAEDGAAIILSLDHKNTYGGNDLYVSFKVAENKYGKPIHLGPAVNSMAHEKSPYLSSDGKSLFFSSNRSSVRGGYDIFMVYRLDDSWQSWTSPKQFLEPVNTSANEGFPSFNRKSGYLYFSSDRNGSSDIFKVAIAPPISEEVKVVGNILDSSKKRKQGGEVLLRDEENGIYKSTYVSNDGKYEVDVPMGKSYQLLARKPGFQSKRKEIAFSKSDVYFNGVHMDLVLEPLEEGSTIELNTIYFAQSTADILPQSFNELSYLAEVLKTNPNLIIAIEGHTDNQGGQELLLNLSKERALVIKEHLVQKERISGTRIKTVGFGGSHPLNDNLTEMDRKKNRRVEIKIVGKLNKENDSPISQSHAPSPSR